MPVAAREERPSSLQGRNGSNCAVRDRSIVAVIPEPTDQQGHRKRHGSRGGHPIGYNIESYKGRKVVERGFNEDKQWRGLATRYDKLGLTYHGGADLRAITLWLERF